jgi:hypothetical protein
MNRFGTHEFLDLCGQLGCEPYICGNVGSGTARGFIRKSGLRPWSSAPAQTMQRLQKFGIKPKNPLARGEGIINFLSNEPPFRHNSTLKIPRSSAPRRLIEKTRVFFPESAKAAIIIISAVPILLVYLFLQRYFATRIMIGSIKG